ncbi:MAG: hypothetical protein K2H89_02040 [Oscillospiraceae bacterium]|nr:hypothetical protein [Oscillospiraceae bacterium]
MKNINNLIRSQLFQLRHEHDIWRELLACLAFQIIIVLIFALGMETQGIYDVQATGCMFFAENSKMIMLLPVSFVFLLAGQICAGDFTDKTQNYEIMAGHSRSEIYCSRVILSLILGILSGMLLVVVPVVAAGLYYGWGEQMPVSDAVSRILLVAFPMIRMICEAVFLAFISRHPYLPAIVGGGMIMLSSLGMLDQCTPLLGISNVNLLCRIEKYIVFDPQEHLLYTYDASLAGTDIVGTVILSLAGGILALLLGNYFFRKDDIH